MANPSGKDVLQLRIVNTTTKQGSWTGAAAVLCTGSVSKVHTFILESGKVGYKVPPGKTRPLAYVAKLCM